jgi:hypothetical protein
MKAGTQAIVQAGLGNGGWIGRADVLLRVDHPERSSHLGNWSYEVVDCKLALETKAETILQLCLYSDLLIEVLEQSPQSLLASNSSLSTLWVQPNQETAAGSLYLVDSSRRDNAR